MYSFTVALFAMVSALGYVAALLLALTAALIIVGFVLAHHLGRIARAQESLAGDVREVVNTQAAEQEISIWEEIR